MTKPAKTGLRGTITQRRAGDTEITGLHVLRNVWTQTRLFGRHCELLEASLSAAIASTRGAVPRRASRGFRIESVPEGSRKKVGKYSARSVERAIEQAIYLACGPSGSFQLNEFFGRVIAYQVPLFDNGGKDRWGHIDLLGLDAKGYPIVVELKRGASRETPLRCVMEGVANAIAVSENWDDLRGEIAAFLSPTHPNIEVAEAVQSVSTVVLAPAEYWAAWEPSGTPGYAVKEPAREAFRRVCKSSTEIGYPIVLAEFDWPFQHDPSVIAARTTFGPLRHTEEDIPPKQDF